jgi:hypothetical protein
MQTREQLERRVADLEKQLATSGRGTAMVRGIRKRSGFEIANLPLYDIAMGPDPGRGERRGHARGIVAIGDIATGVVAIGGFARGLVAAGGFAIGALSFGGGSIGLLAAFGGAAVGSLAFGGAALGGVAVGGGALGYYACGGGAAGVHTVDARRRDPEAVAFFREHGFAACGR